MAIGSSFEQFEKSSGGACKSRLDYRPLSHNQALEIDRLKHVLFESKGLRNRADHQLDGPPLVICMSASDLHVRADCVTAQKLAPAIEPGSINQTKQR